MNDPRRIDSHIRLHLRNDKSSRPLVGGILYLSAVAEDEKCDTQSKDALLLPKHATALIAAPGSASLAAQAAVPVENVMWCGWRCHRFHHRAFFFHHRPAFAFHRFHHRPFFHRRWV